MGFAIAYQTTEALSPALQREVIAAAGKLSSGRTWLKCEPPLLHDDDGFLRGASKPNFTPHPDDVKSAMAAGLPDGTVNDLLQCLCALSAEFDVEWELSHDYSDGPIGYIRGGECDDDVRVQCEAFSDLADDMMGEGFDLNDL